MKTPTLLALCLMALPVTLPSLALPATPPSLALPATPPSVPRPAMQAARASAWEPFPLRDLRAGGANLFRARRRAAARLLVPGSAAPIRANRQGGSRLRDGALGRRDELVSPNLGPAGRCHGRAWVARNAGGAGASGEDRARARVRGGLERFLSSLARETIRPASRHTPPPWASSIRTIPRTPMPARSTRWRCWRRRRRMMTA